MFCAFHEPAALYRPLSFFSQKVWAEPINHPFRLLLLLVLYTKNTILHIYCSFLFYIIPFLSSGALFHLCLQHKKRRRMDFRVRSAALLVLENETGGVTFPHLLTMGDGCLFRPPILLSSLLYQNLKICQIPVLNQYFFNVPFSIKFLARFVFKR